MLNIQELENSVVVVILNSGREILCKLWNTSPDKDFLIVENPRYITFNANTGEANMIVMTVTSNLSTVYLSTSGILTVMAANDDVAEEYENIIRAESNAE